MPVQNLYINEKVVSRFFALNKNSYLAHAYLFLGPKNSGKSETAFIIAKMLNCEASSKEEMFCDKCPACLKVNTGNHPDIHFLEGTLDETIKIEQVREVLEQARLRPFMSSKKIFIIKNIEYLSQEGANALLKTLEEPTPNSLLLLTSSTPEEILETVKSRCHIVKFSPYSIDMAVKALEETYSMDENQAHFLAYLSEGCVGKAIKLKENDFISHKNEIINNFIFNRNSDAFLKDILAEKEKTRQFLDVLVSWIRDSIMLKSFVKANRIANIDRFEELKIFEHKFSMGELEEIYKSVVDMYKLLVENLNLKVPLLILTSNVQR